MHQIAMLDLASFGLAGRARRVDNVSQIGWMEISVRIVIMRGR
jgi:hypothetical protein